MTQRSGWGHGGLQRKLVHDKRGGCCRISVDLNYAQVRFVVDGYVELSVRTDLDGAKLLVVVLLRHRCRHLYLVRRAERVEGKFIQFRSGIQQGGEQLIAARAELNAIYFTGAVVQGD